MGSSISECPQTDRPGLDSAEVHRRFLAERRILAELEHPHIARLLNAGVWPTDDRGSLWNTWRASHSRLGATPTGWDWWRASSSSSTFATPL
jgi:hypothetical protein